MLTQQRLKQVLHYDPATGVFTALIRRGKVRAGAVVGSLNAAGYVQIQIDRKNYYGHRLAWLYAHGSWPPADIDHRDTVKHHNWLSNLRLCTPSQNAGNSRLGANNTSGHKGVYFNTQRGKWAAQIKVSRRTIPLGRFTTKAEAERAYMARANKIFGPFARAR